ncbi:MAG TPA: DUF5652 family protein [Chitinophagaceae bacterium]
MLQYFNETIAGLWPVIIGLVIWEIVWKIIAMWRSARNNDIIWFVCIAILNTLGVLSIIYILTHQKRETT